MALRNLVSWGIDALGKSLSVATFFSGVHVFNTYLFTPIYAIGPSMIPTLHLTGNYLVAERISTRLGTVRRGDIVTVRSPSAPRKVITKRVVGMEGDHITYVKDPGQNEVLKTVVVPDGHIWVEGDYAPNSTDSRSFGPVPYGLLHAKVFWRIWPYEDFGPLAQKREN